MTKLTEDQIRHLAYEALDTAVAHIQHRLGVETGDNAGVFFSGDRTLKVFRDYIKFELNMQEES